MACALVQNWVNFLTTLAIRGYREMPFTVAVVKLHRALLRAVFAHGIPSAPIIGMVGHLHGFYATVFGANGDVLRLGAAQ
jgi:hypothetical protein